MVALTLVVSVLCLVFAVRQEFKIRDIEERVAHLEYIEKRTRPVSQLKLMKW